MMIKRAIGIMLYCLGMMCSAAIRSDSTNGFTLLTFVYNERNPARCAELMACLEKNLQNDYINKIHVFYDVSSDDDQNVLFNYLITRSVKMTITTDRPTYGDFFELANKFYPKQKVIVANADIFFNKSLGLLMDFDFTNKFLALTRWDVQKDGSLELIDFEKGNGKSWQNTYAQDAWIFRTPLKPFRCYDIKLGLLGCDPEIVYWAQKSGLDVINPCLSVNACHLHLSGIRNYNQQERPYTKEPEVLVPYSVINI